MGFEGLWSLVFGLGLCLGLFVESESDEGNPIVYRVCMCVWDFFALCVCGIQGVLSGGKRVVWDVMWDVIISMANFSGYWGGVDSSLLYFFLHFEMLLPSTLSSPFYLFSILIWIRFL